MRYSLDHSEVWKIIRDLGVRNYIELSALYMEKVGYPLNHTNIKNQLSECGFLSSTLSSRIVSLKIICELQNETN